MQTTTAMKIIDDIAGKYNARIFVRIDKEYKVVVYINGIDRLYKKKYLSNLEGRGDTYTEACIDYIKNLMDRKYNIRYKRKYYATEPLRKMVKSKNVIGLNESGDT